MSIYKQNNNSNIAIRVTQFDPREKPLDGFKGQLAVLKNGDGDNPVFQKLDEGVSTNWVIFNGDSQNASTDDLSTKNVYRSKPKFLNSFPVNIPPVADKARNILIEDNFVYALLHANPGYLVIYDISDLNNVTCSLDKNIEQLGFIDKQNSPNALVKKGDYVYVAGNLGRLDVFDVSDKTNPVRVFAQKIFSSANSQVFEMGIDKESDLIFLAYASGTAGLGIVDISNPLNPVGLSLQGGAMGGVAVDVINKIAFSTQYSSAEVQIYDYSDKNNIININTFSVGSFPVQIDIKENLLFVSEYINNETYIYDRSDNLNVILESTIIKDGRAAFNRPHHFPCEDNYLLLIDYVNNIYFYDIKNPASPILNWKFVMESVSVANTQGISLFGDFIAIARRNPDQFEIYKMQTSINPEQVYYNDVDNNFASPKPVNLQDAVNRIASLVKTLNGNVDIP